LLLGVANVVDVHKRLKRFKHPGIDPRSTNEHNSKHTSGSRGSSTPVSDRGAQTTTPANKQVAQEVQAPRSLTEEHKQTHQQTLNRLKRFKHTGIGPRNTLASSKPMTSVKTQLDDTRGGSWPKSG
jgi:hypothetical protein